MLKQVSPDDHTRERTEPKESELLITLVHGTWARGLFPEMPHILKTALTSLVLGATVAATLHFYFHATDIVSAGAGVFIAVALLLLQRQFVPLWFEQGSGFVRKLEEELARRGVRASVAPFLWSGANSIVHRAEAGRRLARYLNSQSNKHPRALQVVVAHSHGGTVSLLALDRLADGVNPAIVTLGTPFMEIINSEAMPSAHRIKAAIAKRAMEPTVIFIALVVVQAGLFGSWGPSAYNMLYCAGVIALNIVPLFFGIKESDGRDDLAWLRRQRLGPSDFEALTKGGATLASPRDVLVVRGVNDEANFALTAGSIGTRLSSLGVDASLRALRALGWLVWLAFGMAILKGSGAAEARIDAIIGHPVVAYGVRVAAYGMLATFGLFCLLPLAACLFKSVYGRELALGGYFCEIKSGSSPDAAGEVAMATLPPTEGTGLRHGLYEHEQARDRGVRIPTPPRERTCDSVRQAGRHIGRSVRW